MVILKDLLAKEGEEREIGGCVGGRCGQIRKESK